MLSRFFQQQTDYVFFVCGVAFILLASICAIIGKERLQRLPWGWLGLFGLVQGIHEWLEMAALSLADDLPFLGLRLWVLAFSFVLLMEFGRDGQSRLQGKAPGRWVYIPFLLCILIGSYAGKSGTDAATRYAVGLTGGLWAAWTLFRSSVREQAGRRILFLSSVVMGIYALAAGLIVPSAPFFPASAINKEMFFSSTGLPIELIRGGLALLLAAAVWEYHRQVKWLVSPEIKAKAQNQGLQLAFALVFALLAGWGATEVVGMNREAEERENIIYQAKIAAAALSPEWVKGRAAALHGREEQGNTLLAKQVGEMARANPQVLRMYLMVIQRGRVFLALDSLSGEQSGAGLRFEQPPKELINVFFTGEAEALGPYRGEQGRLLSGFTGLRDPETREVTAVLGIDLRAEDFQGVVARSRISAIWISLLISLILCGSFILRQRLWESAQVIAANEKRLADAQRVAHLGSWTLDPKRKLLSLSEEMSRIFGIAPESAPTSYQELRSLVHPEDRVRLDAAVQKAIESGEGYELDLRVVRPDGTVRYTVSKAEVKKGVEGEVIQLMGTVQDVELMGTLLDITERKMAEEAVREAQQKYADLVNNLEVGIYRSTPVYEGVFLEANPAMAAICEAGSREDLLNRKVKDLYAVPEKWRELSEKILYAGVVRDEEVELVTLKGKRFWGSVTAIVKRDSAGRAYCDGIMTDITERKRAEEQLHELSLTDELTGLYNRRGFMTLAAQQLRMADRLQQGLVLIYMDLDRMKWINDTFGHNEGDRALKNVADLLRKTLRVSDIIARIGGDEFVGLALEAGEMTGELIRSRLQENIMTHNLEQPEGLYELSLSVGIVRYDPFKPWTLDALLERGDRLMYEEKQKKKMDRNG
ncbi:MAG: diguanylate cyclase [Thermodesulfovibrionales bacterium]|jgi:diguanylate cyclase (GGDEF)-like protein/PAS domain S-box-containing protein